jgi:hypothetical protein
VWRSRHTLGECIGAAARCVDWWAHQPVIWREKCLVSCSLLKGKGRAYPQTYPLAAPTVLARVRVRVVRWVCVRSRHLGPHPGLGAAFRYHVYGEPEVRIIGEDVSLRVQHL